MTAQPVSRGLSRHTLVYGVGIMVGKAVAFIMLPFYTRYLTPADYGVMQLVEMTLDIVSIIAGTQIAQGIFRYYHKAETVEDRNAVLSTAVVLLTASFGTAATATGLAAPLVCRLVFGSEEHVTLVRLAAAALGVQSLVIVPFAYLRLRERSGLFTALNTAKLALQVGLNIYFLAGAHMGLRGIFLSTLISNSALGAILAVYLLREVGIRVMVPVARSLFRYGMPLVLTNFATFFSTFGNRYFLNASGDTTMVGLFSLAYQFGFILQTVGFMPFSMMWEPKRFEVARRDSRDIEFSHAFVTMNLLLLSAATGIVLFVDDFIRVMADSSYHSASSLVPLILVAYVFQSWASFQETGILVRERTELITVANVLSALTALVGYALLIPRWHGLGAAAATVVAFAVRQIVTHRLSQKLWPIRYDWAPVVRLTGAATAVSVASLLVPRLPLAWSVPLHGAFFLVYVALVWRLNIISSEERAWVRDILRSTRRMLPSSAA